MNYFNNVVAGESFRLLAEDWNKRGMHESELWIAQQLGLTEDEIKRVRAGNFSATSSDLLSKIVQNGVARTQFNTEAKYRQGKVTAHPVLRELFPYQTYAAGAARNTIAMGEEFVKAMAEFKRTGNPLRVLLAGKRIFHMVALYTGVGLLTGALRRLATGAPPEEDEKTLVAKMFQGLTEVQLLGPASRLIMFSDPYNKDITKIVFGLMPKVQAAGDVITLAYNAGQQAIGSDKSLGRLGELSVGIQTKELSKRHAAAVRSVLRWYDKTIFPKQQDYKRVRAMSRAFLKKHDLDVGPTDLKVNKDYYSIKQALQNLDLNLAMEELQKLVRRNIEKGITPLETFTSVRQSLVASRPINMSSGLQLIFLSQLSVEDRQLALQTELMYEAITNALVPRRSSNRERKIKWGPRERAAATAAE